MNYVTTNGWIDNGKWEEISDCEEVYQWVIRDCWGKSQQKLDDRWI